jgi:ferredoxin
MDSVSRVSFLSEYLKPTSIVFDLKAKDKVQALDELCEVLAKQKFIAIKKLILTRLIDRERCDACGKCSEACPSAALEVIGKTWTVDALMEEILKDRIFYETSGGGVTFGGGEPMMQLDFLGNLLLSVERRLGGGPDDRLIAIDLHHGRVRLNRRMRLVAVQVGFLEDALRFGLPFLKIPGLRQLLLGIMQVPAVQQQTGIAFALFPFQRPNLQACVRLHPRQVDLDCLEQRFKRLLEIILLLPMESLAAMANLKALFIDMGRRN